MEIDELRTAGVANSDIRWLLCRGYVEHAAERVGKGAQQGRSFQRLAKLILPQNTCFVLTAEGSSLVTIATEMDGVLARNERGQGAGPTPAGVPSWNPMLRRVSWDGRLVKQFRLPAANQEIILASLEEQGWPQRIDDPLPRVHGQDAKTRLHDTIKCLNRNQANRLLSFRGDGTGQGILWHPLVQSRAALVSLDGRPVEGRASGGRQPDSSPSRGYPK